MKNLTIVFGLVLASVNTYAAVGKQIPDGRTLKVECPKITNVEALVDSMETRILVDFNSRSLVRYERFEHQSKLALKALKQIEDALHRAKEAKAHKNTLRMQQWMVAAAELHDELMPKTDRSEYEYLHLANRLLVRDETSIWDNEVNPLNYSDLEVITEKLATNDLELALGQIQDQKKIYSEAARIFAGLKVMVEDQLTENVFKLGQNKKSLDPLLKPSSPLCVSSQKSDQKALLRSLILGSSSVEQDARLIRKIDLTESLRRLQIVKTEFKSLRDNFKSARQDVLVLSLARLKAYQVASDFNDLEQALQNMEPSSVDEAFLIRLNRSLVRQEVSLSMALEDL